MLRFFGGDLYRVYPLRLFDTLSLAVTSYAPPGELGDPSAPKFVGLLPAYAAALPA